MDKIAAYEIALGMHEQEKRAEYLVDTYGTCQGEMPSAYLQAFDQMEKDAFWGAAVKGVKSLGQGMIRSGAKGAKQYGGITKATGGVGTGGWKMNKGLGMGDQLKYGLRRAQMGIGRYVTAKPGRALVGTAGGAVGTAGLGAMALRRR